MKKKLALLLAALCLLLALTGCGEKEQSVHVTLYNQSGHDITSVCITPASSDDWGENFLDETLADGNGVTIGLGTYKESEVPTEWNILVYGEEDCILYETDVDEVDFTMHDGDCVVFQSPEEAISIVVCTDAEYQELYADYTPGAAAEEVEEAAGMDVNEMGDAGDISGYTGCWKLDNEPFYFVINEEYEWIAVNLYGEQVGPGYVVNEGENITLCMEDGTEHVSLWQTAYGA